MQPLNDDDMDELLRRAAEDYPLNTDSDDWNKVMQQLHDGEEDLPKESKKNNDFKYLWLLLLLPIGFTCGKYVGNGNNGTAIKLNIKSDKTAAPTTETSGSKTATSIKADRSVNKPETSDEIENRAATGRNKTNATSGNSSRGNKTVATANVRSKVTPPVTVSSTSVKNGSPVSISYSAKTNLTNKSKLKDYQTGKASLNSKVAVKSKGDTAGTTKVVTGKKTSGAEIKNIAANEMPLKADTAVNDLRKTNSVQPVETAKNASVKKSPVATSFKRNLYYSFLIGPDVSMVKFQKTSSIGYSTGLMLGYQLNRKVAVEAGLLWDRKNYYSKGDYLDTNGLQLPMHSIVSKAEGMCDMFEIPVNIKYDFIIKKKHSFFISAGLSSYIMKKENYNLSYERYNQPYVKDYDYTNSSRDWFSIMSISAGYKTIKGKTNISVAPYAKLPLRGVGIGKLPVTSAGFYLILSRSVH